MKNLVEALQVIKLVLIVLIMYWAIKTWLGV